jgi:hypothetical protein
LKWERGNIFDETFVNLLDDHLKEFSHCVVSSVSHREKPK